MRSAVSRGQFLTRLVRWGLLGVGTLPTALFGQVVVRVTDVADHPVPAALVELWSASERVAARVTDSDGLARFIAGERARSHAAIVRRIGFLPGHLILGSASDTVVVHLEPLSGSLPSITVLAARQACPQTDSPEARQLWREVASRYLTPSTQGRQANVEERRATVAEDQVGSVGTGSLRTGWRLYTLGGMSGARASIAQRGYIRPLSGSHIYDDFGIWRYPPLHAELAGHFVDSLFGEAHTLTLSRADARNLVLRFCARDRRRDGLDGVMRVDASGSLSDARWTYWNPARDAELAGGEVIFTPLAESGHAPLFAASGLFWRRLPSKRFLQSWQDYSAWELLADSVGTNGASRRPAP